MLISDLDYRSETVTAKLQFERRQSSPISGFITGDVVADAGAFALASWLPSWASREKRIAVDGVVCPLLVSNLRVAAKTLKRWYPEFPSDPPEIQAELVSRPIGTGRAAFISGGVDSLSMVKELQGHIDAAVLIDYQQIGGLSEAETEARFEERSSICETLCKDLGIEFKAVRTNLRALNSSMGFWIDKYHGSFLAAIAHSLPYGEVFIAGTYDAKHLSKWGSHPLLDPFYSSVRVTIRHYGLHQSRLEKVRTLGEWPMALDLVNVCVNPRSKGKNCGRCEKCLRTRLELMALGLESKAFPQVTVEPEELERLRISNDYAWSCYSDVLPLIPKELALIVERKKPRLPAALKRLKKSAKEVLKIN